MYLLPRPSSTPLSTLSLSTSLSLSFLSSFQIFSSPFPVLSPTHENPPASDQDSNLLPVTASVVLINNREHAAWHTTNLMAITRREKIRDWIKCRHLLRNLLLVIPRQESYLPGGAVETSFSLEESPSLTTNKMEEEELCSTKLCCGGTCHASLIFTHASPSIKVSIRSAPREGRGLLYRRPSRRQPHLASRSLSST